MSEKRLPTRTPYTVAEDEGEDMSEEDIRRIDRANQGLDGFELSELRGSEGAAALAYTKEFYKRHGITSPS